MLAASLTLGATTMTATEPQKKEGEKKEPWTEQVTVRKYLNALKGFGDKPQTGIDAYRGKIKDKDVIYLSLARLPDFDAGTEITDKDGNTYRVDKKFQTTGKERGAGCFVSLVSAPKKKEPE